MPESLYHYILRISRHGQINLGVMCLVIAPLAMVPLELQKRIVDDAIVGKDFDLLLILGAIYLGVTLLHVVLNFALNYYGGLVGECVIRDLRQAVYRCTRADGAAAEKEAIFPLAAAREGKKSQRTEQVDKGTIVSMMAAEVEPLGVFVGESVAFPLLHGGTVVTVFGYLLYIQPMLALFAVLLYSPAFFLVPWLQKAINRNSNERAKTVRELGDFIVGDDQGPSKSGGLPENLTDLLSRIYRLRLRIYRSKFLMKSFINFLGFIGPLSILVIGGWLAIEGQTTVGTILALISGLQKIRNPLRGMINFYRRVSDARVKYRLLTESFA
jgi:ABC-type multidrug transport system fused ATPase/permease subunit